MKFSCHFEGELLAVRGRTCVPRGCSRTLKTPNSPPLGPSGTTGPPAANTSLGRPETDQLDHTDRVHETNRHPPPPPEKRRATAEATCGDPPTARRAGRTARLRWYLRRRMSHIYHAPSVVNHHPFHGGGQQKRQ